MGMTGFECSVPEHLVTVDSFLISPYEVTQRLYQDVMGTNPSKNKGDNFPVEQVTWHEAMEFCNALSVREGKTPAYVIIDEKILWNKKADGYRLPTSAEWEYAARGAVKGRGYVYAGGNTLNDVGWYKENSAGSSHPIGEKRPNELGLFDMSGNVSEWCWDWLGSGHTKEHTVNPDGSEVSYREMVICRGGSWESPAKWAWVVYENGAQPWFPDWVIGIRLVCSIHNTEGDR